MRLRWLVVAIWALTSIPAEARRAPPAITAQTQGEVSGDISNGAVHWTCANHECRASLTLVAPTVPACVALARRVGRIVSFGRPGATLGPLQLTTCNEWAAAHASNSAPTSPPPRQPDARVGFQLAGRDQDAQLYVMPNVGITLHGASPTRPAPTISHMTAIVDGVLQTGPFNYRGSVANTELGTERAESAAGYPHDVIIRIPMSLRNMPPNTLFTMDCSLSSARWAFEEDDQLLGVTGGFAFSRWVGSGSAGLMLHGDWEGVLEVAVALLPYYDISDARSYACDFTIRPPDRYRNHQWAGWEQLNDRSSAHFIADYVVPPDAERPVEPLGNIQ